MRHDATPAGARPIEPPAADAMRAARARAWLLACRVPTLPASLVPVVVGTAAAALRHPVKPAVLAVTVVAALLLQTVANFANDLFDFRSGADSEQRLGPRRGLQSGLITERQLTVALLGVIAAAIICGLYLVHVGGVPILVVGLASIAAAVAYTGGPYPLGYHGLGDVFVFVFFGLVAVCGTYYLQAGAVDTVAVLAAVPVGLIVTAILVVNNVRDVETDRRAGKRTLVVLLGKEGGRLEYALCLAGAYAVPPLMLASGTAGGWILLPWLSIPVAVACTRAIYADEGPRLNLLLKRTGQLNLLYGALFAVGLAAS